FAQAPDEPLVPLPIIGVFGLYTLFITIAFLGGWIGTTSFAYIQSVADLALVAATLFLAPALLDRTYMVLLVVAAIIGLRRFAWGPTMGFAVLAAAVGVFAQRAGLALLSGGGDPTELIMPVLGPALAPGLVVIAARLVAGDPIPAELLNRRPPMRDDQVRALRGLSKTIGDQNDREPLLKEAYRVMLNHTGAVGGAGTGLVDPTLRTGRAYALAGGRARVKPVALAPEGTAPHERVLREGKLRLTRQREPLPVVEVVGERGAVSFAGVPMRTG